MTLEECLGLGTTEEQPEEESTLRKLWIVLNVKSKGETLKIRIYWGENPYDRIWKFCALHQIGSKNEHKLYDAVKSFAP